MSKSKHTNPAYISHVHLKGYKSIIDTEVELHPGINVIIGPNGSGKTNFLEFLYKIGTIKFEELPNEIAGTLKFYFHNNDDNHVYKFKKIVIYNEESQKVESKLNETLKSKRTNIDSEKHQKGMNNYFYLFPIPNSLSKWHEIEPIIVNYGLPNEIQNLSQSLSFEITLNEIKRASEDLIIPFPNFFLNYKFNPNITQGLKKNIRRHL